MLITSYASASQGKMSFYGAMWNKNISFAPFWVGPMCEAYTMLLLSHTL